MDFHDPISSGSHLLMAGWTAFTAVILLRITRRHPLGHRVSVVVYAASAVALYTASGLFHGLNHPSPESRRAWQLLDQTAIFGLILGSNVPIYWYLLKPPARYWLLGMMATVGAVGAACLWVLPFVTGKPPHVLLVCVYLSMGVLGLVPIRTYFRFIGWPGVVWVGLLVVFYVGGGVCEAVSWPTLVPGWFTYHEVLHLADMAGTTAHLVLLIKYVLPAADPRPARRPVALAA